MRAKQGYVLATASPVTSSIVDSALHVLALHGKQHVRRRCVWAACSQTSNVSMCLCGYLQAPQSIWPQHDCMTGAQ